MTALSLPEAAHSGVVSRSALFPPPVEVVQATGSDFEADFVRHGLRLGQFTKSEFPRCAVCNQLDGFRAGDSTEPDGFRQGVKRIFTCENVCAVNYFSLIMISDRGPLVPRNHDWLAQ